MPETEANARRLLLDWLDTGLRAVHGTGLVQRALAAWRPGAPVRMVALGKAASAMAQGAHTALSARIAAGLVIAPRDTPGDTDELPDNFIQCHGAHPVPNEDSLQAGDALIQFIRRAPAPTQWLFLISGGASSLVEALPPWLSLSDLQRANHWLLASGWDITRINALRQRLSLIKGGRLAAMLGQTPVRALYLSDVPGNDPALIGSGLLARTLPEPDVSGAPDWLRGLYAKVETMGDFGRSHIETGILADNTSVLAAAAQAARSNGFSVSVHEQGLAGDAAATGVEIAQTIMRSEPGVHLWGGECTIALPADAGTGGRCQHLALAAAQALANRHGCYLLAAGTDGRDGSSTAAGALVDGDTVQRGADAGLSAQDALQKADSHRFLEASGDLIDTGPTGTNVNDLVIGFKT